MAITSLGYHTFSMLNCVESHYELKEILNAFKSYSKETGLIKIHGFGKKTKYKKYDNTEFETYTNYNIFFYNQQKYGVSWTLKFCNYSSNYRFTYIIEARVNPKILIGTNDYITASSEGDFEQLQLCYNNLVKSISAEIPLFSEYTICRIDYCINADIKEMGYDCTAEELMELLKRSDVPYPLKKSQQYCHTSRRLKDYVNSFNLECNSYNINCYYKHYQLLNEHPENPAIEASKHVIRFEIQCKYLKVYNLKEAFRYADNCTELILSDKMSDETVTKYFSKVIMLGDYYSLKMARKMVIERDFCTSKQERLLNTLELISTHKGIHKARQHLDDISAKSDFERSLKELVGMDINPVTIPRNWGYDYLPNLLKSYRDLKNFNNFNNFKNL